MDAHYEFVQRLQHVLATGTPIQGVDVRNVSGLERHPWAGVYREPPEWSRQAI